MPLCGVATLTCLDPNIGLEANICFWVFPSHGAELLNLFAAQSLAFLTEAGKVLFWKILLPRFHLLLTSREEWLALASNMEDTVRPSAI